MSKYILGFLHASLISVFLFAIKISEEFIVAATIAIVLTLFFWIIFLIKRVIEGED